MNGSSVGASWRAVGWLLGLNALGFALVIGALLSTFCFMCGESEPMSGGAQLALALGIAAFVAAPALAARSTGWPLWLLVGFGALVFGAGGMALGAAMFEDGLAGLALGLTVEGAIAVRPRWPGAIVARAVAIGAIAVASLGSSAASDTGLMLPLLALPAIAVGDMLAASHADPRRRDAAPTLTRP